METAEKRPLTEKQLAFQERQKGIWEEKRRQKELLSNQPRTAEKDYATQHDEPDYVPQPKTTQRPLDPPAKKQKYDPKKRYHFQLAQEHLNAKPKDYDTGEIMDNPYPPWFFIEPSGTGINPDSGEIEHWRYLAGYPSIWIKDQMKPEPTEAQLANPKNFIEFKNGSLFVSGQNTALLDALHIQDCFAGVVSPLNIVPPTFRLVNPEAELRKTRSISDLRYEASKAAREIPFEQMLPIAMYFGINVDKPQADKERIRTEFIFRAESDPENFNKQFINPRLKYKYTITLALRANLISTNIIPGKMVLVGPNTIFFDVKEGDSAQQFADLVYNRNEQAINLYGQIENLLANHASNY